MPRPMGRNAKGKGKGKDGKKRERGNNLFKRKKFCRFTAEGVKQIDYKDIDYLSKFLTPQAQIHSRKRSGFCAQCQRELKEAMFRTPTFAKIW